MFRHSYCQNRFCQSNARGPVAAGQPVHSEGLAHEPLAGKLRRALESQVANHPVAKDTQAGEVSSERAIVEVTLDDRLEPSSTLPLPPPASPRVHLTKANWE